MAKMTRPGATLLFASAMVAAVSCASSSSALPLVVPRGGAAANAAAAGGTAVCSSPPHPPPPSNGTSAVIDNVSVSADGSSAAFAAVPATFVESSAASSSSSSHGRAAAGKTALSATATATTATLKSPAADVGRPAIEREESFVDEDGGEVAEVERTPEEIEAEIEKLTEKKGGPLRVLFLSADTGGGHRASAESLAKSFQVHYPGTTYDLLDIWSPIGKWPYKTLVPAYKHMSARPSQWKLFYHVSNNFFFEIWCDFCTRLRCERDVRNMIESYDPDVVVSVHPAMNSVPIISTRKISRRRGRDIPFFTVVTDFGSGHTTWFQRGVDKMFVASERIRKLAKKRGRVPDDKLVMSGLPIRHDFAVQAERLGDRTSEAGREYQRSVREELGVDAGRNMVLVMGGGEGVGSLSDIVDGLYAKFRKAGVDATIYVVCGRNEKLREELATKCWDTVLQESHLPKKTFHPLGFLRPHRSRRIQRALDEAHAKERAEEEEGRHHAPGKVDVVGLGFVTNMAEYMVAADVLVTKAGPGTIAEAAAVGLPVMLTSFLPGQEAGNVNVVLDGGFGDYCEDPDGIADEVSCWLGDSRLMAEMSHRAREVGHPHAASDIALEIGQFAHMKKGDADAALN